LKRFVFGSLRDDKVDVTLLGKIFASYKRNLNQMLCAFAINQKQKKQKKSLRKTESLSFIFHAEH